MSKKWIKRIVIALSIPVVLLLILIILLYTPPVQNFLLRKVTAYISRTIGMDVTINHVNIRFPIDLVAKDVRIIQAPDTLVALESLGLKVRIRPLLNGEIQAHGVFLENAHINTARMLPTMQLRGSLGRFYLDTKILNLSQQLVDLKKLELNDASLFLTMKDTIVVSDTTTTPARWKIILPELDIENVVFNMDIPADSIVINAYIGNGEAKDLLIDLGQTLYTVGNITFENTRANYDRGTAAPTEKIDYSHLALMDVRINIDSIVYRGREMGAIIHDFTMTERSGLSIASMSGELKMDSVGLKIPAFNLRTPHSELSLSSQTTWDAGTPYNINHIEAKLNGRVGIEDVLFFAGDMPASFVREYPGRPLEIQVDIEGDTEHIKIIQLDADLPGAFTLKGKGDIFHIKDSLNRAADINLQMKTQHLDFLLSLAEMPRDGSIVIPPLSANVGIKVNGTQLAANVLARESAGTLKLNANYNLSSEAYKADITLDSLQVKHFMPKDSIYSLSATANITGRGINFKSPRSIATVKASVSNIHYSQYHFSGIDLEGELKNAVVTAHLTCNNTYLVMDAWAEYKTNTRYIDARASVNVADMNLYALRLIDKPMTSNLSFALAAEAKQDSVKLTLVSGDLEARLYAQGPLKPLIDKSLAFTKEITQQIEARELNHIRIRNSLPSARLNVYAGQQNPVSRYMIPGNIRFANFRAGFIVNPERGINGMARVQGLHADTLQLDTVFVVAFQDTARLNLRAGIINGPRNPQYTFRATVTGEVRTNDAEVLLDFKNDKGETGVRLGAIARPASDGIQIDLIPANPIVAFREFYFNNHNKVFVRNNGRVLADVQMFNHDGMGLSVRSMPDTTYLQNLDIEIRRIELGDVSRILPYYPTFSGLLNAEATFQKSEDNMQLSTDIHINEFYYEERRVGNFGLGATWLPGADNKHYIDAYATIENTQILTANGIYQSGVNDNLDVNAYLEHVPLYLANLFIDKNLAELHGDLDGDLSIRGSASQPQINGELVLDSVRVLSNLYGLTFRIEDRPLKITNSRLLFDKFNLYSASTNPFTINGLVDFTNLSNPRADLTLTATNFELLNASRHEGRILYGKAYIDLNTTIRGPLRELMMRGNLNILGTTDVNYVLTDSPLTVQDRLGDLVQFVSFADTVSVAQEEPAISLGGMDIRITINIDQAVKLGVDLATDRSNYVDLEGGGNLTFQYTPQSDKILTGRYTVNGGTLKYSLPIIPLKEFSIDQGSYVEWIADPMNPNLHIRASERVRVNVPGADGSQMVIFVPSIVIRNTLEELELEFDVSAPDNQDIQAELQAMAPEERSKQAVGIMAAGIYLARGSAGGGGLNMAALSNFIQGQLFGFAGGLLNSSSFTVDTDTYNDASGSRTDFNFKYSQRFFNDRVQVVIGGKVSTANTAQQAQSFIDNISLEYRLDKSGTRYVRIYHDRNFENVFEGEIVETGVGMVLRKRVNKLGELFIFRNRNKQ